MSAHVNTAIPCEVRRLNFITDFMRVIRPNTHGFLFHFIKAHITLEENCDVETTRNVAVKLQISSTTKKNLTDIIY